MIEKKTLQHPPLTRYPFQAVQYSRQNQCSLKTNIVELIKILYFEPTICVHICTNIWNPIEKQFAKILYFPIDVTVRSTRTTRRC